MSRRTPEEAKADRDKAKAELEAKPTKRPRKKKLLAPVVVDDTFRRQLTNLGLRFEWLESLANQYGFDEYRYMDKFKAFRCYREGVHIEWVNINDLALLNGKRHLLEIKQKHQDLGPKRRIIKFPWRP